MESELFTVYIKDGGVISIEINEDVMKAYEMTLEEFENKFYSENLMIGIKDFVDCLNK